MSSVLSFSICRSTRSPPGRPLTTSVRRRAGTVMAPSTSILPGTQAEMPISRLVAVRRRPPSWVLRSTLDRTGNVARLLTARLTRDRPRARFSCIKDSFTSGGLPAKWGWMNLIFSSHHPLHAVDCADSLSGGRMIRACAPAAGPADRRWAGRSSARRVCGQPCEPSTRGPERHPGCPPPAEPEVSAGLRLRPPAAHSPRGRSGLRNWRRWSPARQPARGAAPRCARPPGRSSGRRAAPWSDRARPALPRCAGARRPSPRA